MLGAYGVAMTTRFNGFGDIETVRGRTMRRWLSMFGLAPRSIADARAAETRATSCKLSRARGRKRRKR